MLDIKAVGVKGVQRYLRKLGPDVDKVLTRAVNRTADKARTVGGRKIREQVNLKANYVRENLKVTYARKGQATARVTATRRPVLLTRFNARQLSRGGNPAGVSFAITKRKGKSINRSAFFIRLRAGKVNQAGAIGVVAREFEGKGTRDKRVGRTPLKVFHGPSVDQVFRDVRREIEPEVGRFLRTEIIRLANVEIGRR